MMINGQISTDRSLLKWRWFTDPCTAHLWEYIRLKANWREQNWKSLKIERGSFVTSYKTMSMETGLTTQQIRTALKKLESTGEILRKSTNKYQLITVVNYDVYQRPWSECNNQSTGKQQTSNKQVTNNQQQLNKENKGNNNNNNIDILSCDRAVAQRVIMYLNEKMGTNYKSNTRETLRNISARLKDGYTEEDFYKVIDGRIMAWGNDPKMSQYIRPKTLFRHSNFENYLNAPVHTAQQQTSISYIDIADRLEKTWK